MEEEEIPSSTSKRRKIEETVVSILKNADMETATEYSVRAAAAQQLCTDLSDLSHKCLVRQVLESFLLSTATPPTLDKVSVPESIKETVAAVVRDDQQLSNYNNNGGVICKLSDKRIVAVHDFKGKALVSIRNCCVKDGKQVPSGRGISLTGRQWSLFRNSFPAIEEAIGKIASQIRVAAVEEQSGPDLLVSNIATQGILTIDQNRMETDISNSLNAVDPQRQIGTIKNVEGDTNDSVATPNGRHSVQADMIQENSIDVLDHQRLRDREKT